MQHVILSEGPPVLTPQAAGAAPGAIDLIAAQVRAGVAAARRPAVDSQAAAGNPHNRHPQMPYMLQGFSTQITTSTIGLMRPINRK